MGTGTANDDSSMVEGCIRRDPDAWKLFLRKYTHLVSISIASRLRKYGLAVPAEELKDICQMAITSIWQDKKFESLTNRSNIAYWVAMVSGNCAMDYMRKRHAGDKLQPISLFEYAGDGELLQLIASPVPVTSDGAARGELAKKIRYAMRSLPDNEKLAIRLLLLHGKKYHEIAELLGTTHSTVASRIKRAKEKLRKELADFR